MVLKNKPLGFKLSTAWLSLCVLMATFGWLLPLPSWDSSDGADFAASARKVALTTRDAINAAG